VLIQEPYFSDEAGKFLAREAGIRVAVVSASAADAVPGAYARHLEEVMAAVGGTLPPAGR
jgi:hypothetical protein